ncbi:MAG: sigma-70 family RNA polymerase sigma factor, partial [Oscillospiraceae bacterium]|nr:sigma-70 family RNA polymerase sigma factor [Oscillospiraceae bacterium]
HRGKFRAYLYKIAANVCIDYSRKKTMEQLPDDLQEYDSHLEQIESDANFVWLLRDLPDEQREVVLLRFVHELKVREITEVVGVPMRTVQSRLRSALKRIERDFGKEER